MHRRVNLPNQRPKEDVKRIEKRSNGKDVSLLASKSNYFRFYALYILSRLNNFLRLVQRVI